jgi:CheY-like chemotaxis protein
VLLNLCVNARDAMPDGGALTLAAENVDLDESYAATMPDAKVGPHVLLRVSDTGTGMPRATIDKIFDPFFTTKQIGKGTGLGLSTALGIVKSHRGFLALYSEPGRGTTFRIFLPATGIEPAAVKPTTSQLVQGNNELILVIDDEEGIRRVTTNTLEKNHYRALEAKDGPEALALFAQQMDSIQLVITDLMLPYMDGLALARALTKMKPDIAIIASTGQGEQTSMSELQSLGVKNFLSKPYDSERLLRTVHEALTGARS